LRRYQSPTRCLRESAPAPPTDSAHSAPRRQTDSSAGLPAAAPADTCRAFRAAAPCSPQNCFTDIPPRCCAAIRSAHSSAFGLTSFASAPLMRPQCSADQYIRKSGSRDAYAQKQVSWRKSQTRQ
jgi:hypothetical protein